MTSVTDKIDRFRQPDHADLWMRQYEWFEVNHYSFGDIIAFHQGDQRPHPTRFAVVAIAESIPRAFKPSPPSTPSSSTPSTTRLPSESIPPKTSTSIPSTPTSTSRSVSPSKPPAPNPSSAMKSVEIKPPINKPLF